MSIQSQEYISHHQSMTPQQGREEGRERERERERYIYMNETLDNEKSK